MFRLMANCCILEVLVSVSLSQFSEVQRLFIRSLHYWHIFIFFGNQACAV